MQVLVQDPVWRPRSPSLCPGLAVPYGHTSESSPQPPLRPGGGKVQGQGGQSGGFQPGTRGASWNAFWTLQWWTDHRGRGFEKCLHLGGEDRSSSSHTLSSAGLTSTLHYIIYGFKLYTWFTNYMVMTNRLITHIPYSQDQPLYYYFFFNLGIT